MFRLDGKVALVTGGSRGIGRAVALTLASAGATVVITYVNGKQGADAVVTEIASKGGKAEAVQLDSASFDATEAGVAEIAKRHGRLDVVIANAGISIDGLLLRLREEDLDKTLAVNLKGAIACARAALKPMMRTKSGRIVFMSSIVAEAGSAGQVAYAASKGAMLSVVKSLAREYASRNITVNAITPGYVATDMTGALTDAQREAMLTQVPLGRPATPEEIGAAALFLASDEAGYITGHALRVNGGMYM